MSDTTFKSDGELEQELNRKLKDRVIKHRNRFYRFFSRRYFEMLPLCITYKNYEMATSIDFLKIEVALRNGYLPVIGEIKSGDLMFIGYVKTSMSVSTPDVLFTQQRVLTKEDITFIIPEEYRLKNMKEITLFDNCQTGNFIVIRNKVLNYTNDNEMVYHYADELAEIVTSRYSLTIQAKLMTIFKGELADETMNQIIDDLFNGAPFVRTSNLFDFEDNVYTFDNTTLASNLVELKREYQNKVSELNNILGINSLAVDKASGVSDTEAKSNSAFTTTNANIYLQARQNALKLLNKRYSMNIEATYDDEAISELSDGAVEVNGEKNNDAD